MRLTDVPQAKLPPAAAVAAARAARMLGHDQRALEVVKAALPSAGELSGALRLEAARAAVSLGRDPMPHLSALLSRSAPSALRREASRVLREAAEAMPVPVVRRWPGQALPKALRRDIRAAAAVRAGDATAAAAILTEREGDNAATRTARFLAGRDRLAVKTRLDVASALLAGGRWSEARVAVDAIPPPATMPDRYRRWWVAGRAAYRLGDFAAADEAFRQAFDTAPDAASRFAVSVQRARIAEIHADFAAAAQWWDGARAAAPAEVEGWDGGGRTRVALGRWSDATAVVASAPPAVRRIVAPRLAASLLLRGRPDEARRILGGLGSTAQVRSLDVALALADGDLPSARVKSAALVADRRAGPWRELALGALPPVAPPGNGTSPTSDPAALAVLATTSGLGAARQALGAALAADLRWAALLGREPLPQPDWSGPAALLASIGLVRDAARLYPHRFPDDTPAGLAWSARALASWGNAPAALSAGEQLWARLGVPATLLPDPLLERVLPRELLSEVIGAAGDGPIPASWLAAVIRRESRFDPFARSAVGALGAAQLMPDVARRLGADESDVWDSGLSHRLAARELARLAGIVGRDPAAVAAAYNAGEAVTAAWRAALSEVPSQPAASGEGVRRLLFTSAIPYRETSGYVLAVLEGLALARHLE
ncbi:MAG: transglycosylase SLT domain-containing protein [Acidobacteriota bacterium]